MNELAEALHEKEVTDYSGTAQRAQPISEASVVQLAPGPKPSDLTFCSSSKLTLIGLRHHAPSVGIVVLRPEYFGFMWWQGQSDVRINGELARFTELYSQGTQDGFHATGGERMTMGIAVRRRDLVETVAALRGVDPEDVLLKHSALQLSRQAAYQFRSDINAHVQRSVRPSAKLTGSASPEDTGEAIFGALVDAYLHSLPTRLRDDNPFPPEQLVRKAEERFFAAGERPVSLADLCAAAGVSQATLYRAFHHVCDQPPLAYLHKRRLHNARRNLVSTVPVRGAVKQIALSAGFTELGRFSVQYRFLFGESPSTTLNRTPL